jgi:hypothetical protein
MSRDAVWGWTVSLVPAIPLMQVDDLGFVVPFSLQ